jgi:hypothetical protein
LEEVSEVHKEVLVVDSVVVSVAASEEVSEVVLEEEEVSEEA